MNNTVKLIAAAAILGLAGFLYVSLSGGESLPADPATLSYWKCMDCGHVQELTPRDYESKRQFMVRLGEDKTAGGGKLRGKINAVPGIICSQCGNVSAIGAYKCPNDNEIFASRSKDGSNASCPKCGWTRDPKGVAGARDKAGEDDF